MNRRSFVRSMAAAVLIVAAGAATAEQIEIRLFDRFYSANNREYSEWLVNSFNEKFAGKIHASWDGVEDPGFRAKINAVLRSPTPPDVFYSWEGGWAKYMIDNGYAAPLDEYYAKYNWEAELSPAGVKLATIDGKKWFVPTMMSASIVWYRPDIFEKNGISVPTTWDEFLAAGEKLKAAGVAPTMLANQNKWPAQFLWSAIFVNKYGVEAYDQLIARKIAWTDPRVIDVFAMMKKLADDGYFEQGANGLDVTPAVVPFSKGEVGTWYQGSFMIQRFTEESGEAKFPLDYFAFPKVGEQAPTISVFAENTFMMHANSQNKDAAAEFLNYAISREAQAKQTELREMFPANQHVDLSGLKPLFQKLGKEIATYEQATFMHNDHALGPAVADVYLQGLQGVLVGTTTPEDAAQQTEDSALQEQGPVVQ